MKRVRKDKMRGKNPRMTSFIYRTLQETLPGSEVQASVKDSPNENQQTTGRIQEKGVNEAHQTPAHKSEMDME